MVYGIDISNWQNGLQLSTSDADFYVMKATEGTSYVDRCCDPWVQWCISNGKPWGFYHFMRPNGGVAEAEFFYTNTRNYFTHGVPILDFEDTSLSTEDGEAFIWRLHELTNVWPLLYANSDFINNRGYFSNSWVRDKCGLWLAGYPSRRTSWPSDATCPYAHDGWTLAMWQFTSSLSFGGMSVDGDVFYGDEEAWGKYAMGDNEAQSNDATESNEIVIPREDNAVYRFYSPDIKDHLLTSNYDEAMNLANSGWTYEGIAFYAART